MGVACSAHRFRVPVWSMSQCLLDIGEELVCVCAWWFLSINAFIAENCAFVIVLSVVSDMYSEVKFSYVL